MIYGIFAYLTFKIIAGAGGNQAKKHQDLTATVMRHPAGSGWSASSAWPS